MESAVGLGLFDFGFRDGPAAEARLQHCLGVTVLPDGSVAAEFHAIPLEEYPGYGS